MLADFWRNGDTYVVHAAEGETVIPLEVLEKNPKLKNMICIVDWNKGQNDGYTKDFSVMYDNLQERISSFGWRTKIIDGHDMQVIRDNLNFEREFSHLADDKPLCLILDTIKGKGVSFMEHPSWHCKVPTEEEYEIAMKELGV